MFLDRFAIRDFVAQASTLSDTLRERFRLIYGISPSTSEVVSWQQSLPALARVLTQLPESAQSCTIYLEYGMPSSSSRADALLVGLDRQGQRAAVVVELKQWDAVAIHPDGYNVRVGGQVHPHPSDQALGYRDYLADLSPAFADVPKTLRSCAFLHNAAASGISPLIQEPFSKLTLISPIFAGDQQSEMASWIGGMLVHPPDSRYLAELDEGGVRVSKTLLKTVARAVRDEPAWTLLDEQRVAFNEILRLVEQNDGEQHLVLVTGGPGTGKSVIAMQLMGILSRKQIPTVHVTNSSSFTTVMKSLIQERGSKQWGSRAIEGLFRLSHSWVRRKDYFEVVICDEAHRFRRSTNLYPHLVSSRPQAEEILEHCRIMVAFLDERQRLRRAEEGTVEYFRQCAAAVGIRSKNIHGPIELKTQFRAAGNRAFVEAFDQAMYEGKPVGFAHNHFEVRIVASVEDLECYLQEKVNQGYSARLVAGFCWPWSDPRLDESLVEDVRIGGWSRPWNRKADPGRRYTPLNHPYTLWATRRENPLGEVGCIYSAQGFEFDYVGVIWGLDLVRRGNDWVAQPEASCDGEINPLRRRALAPKEALPLLQNAYRVLVSRGMRGCGIYCEDQETREFLERALAGLSHAPA